MNRLAKHILFLLRIGYPLQMLYGINVTRQALKQNGIPASRGQVRCTLIKHFNDIYTQFLGKRIITGNDFDRAFAAGYEINACQCTNPTPHDVGPCNEARLAQDAGDTPSFHCAICQMSGNDYYADANGIVWVNGVTACELSRQIAERTAWQDEQTRRDMTYAFG
jgi:hypothetical protein